MYHHGSWEKAAGFKTRLCVPPWTHCRPLQASGASSSSSTMWNSCGICSQARWEHRIGQCVWTAVTSLSVTLTAQVEILSPVYAASLYAFFFSLCNWEKPRMKQVCFCFACEEKVVESVLKNVWIKFSLPGDGIFIFYDCSLNKQ